MKSINTYSQRLIQVTSMGQRDWTYWKELFLFRFLVIICDWNPLYLVTLKQKQKRNYR